ncbi:MAG TPA: hypothetical protein PLJ71_03100, partial [Candidatus Hydrogenedentes bacterium]|nr:hypothetical protein [Candidatus Hydrogenedentota bacterium]
ARVDSGERAEWPFPPEFTQQAKRIEDEFYATPLAEMAPQTPRGPDEMAESLRQLESLAAQVLKLPDAG